MRAVGADCKHVHVKTGDKITKRNEGMRDLTESSIIDSITDTLMTLCSRRFVHYDCIVVYLHDRPQCSQLLTHTTDSMEDSAVAMSDEVVMSDLSVTEWLASIKMDRYAEQFVSSGLSIVDDVVHLTLKDLVNLGVTLVGHQKKIMNSIQSLRAQRQHTLDLNSSDLSPNDQNLQATSVGYLV